MHLVQLLIPLYDNSGARFSSDLYVPIRDELLKRFGGLTVYARAPVNGLWQESAGRTVHDDLVIYEVMTPELDESWWRAFRIGLETSFAQQALVVRSFEVRLL